MPETRRRPGPAPKLSREAVLDAARELAPDALTLAAIGAKLGVTGPALYRYFEDRTAILEALAQEAKEKMTPPDASLPWQEWLRQAARIDRELWRSHPDLYDAATYRVIARPALAVTKTGFEVLLRAGFSFEDAVCALTITTEVAHSIGWSESHTEPFYDESDVAELLEMLLPMAAQSEMNPTFMGYDLMFEESLSIAIEGLEARLAKRRKAKPAASK